MSVAATLATNECDTAKENIYAIPFDCGVFVYRNEVLAEERKVEKQIGWTAKAHPFRLTLFCSESEWSLVCALNNLSATCCCGSLLIIISFFNNFSGFTLCWMVLMVMLDADTGGDAGVFALLPVSSFIHKIYSGKWSQWLSSIEWTERLRDVESVFELLNSEMKKD